MLKGFLGVAGFILLIAIFLTGAIALSELSLRYHFEIYTLIVEVVKLPTDLLWVLSMPLIIFLILIFIYLGYVIGKTK